jgi:endonuclease YncB( thermonuclease family)
MSQLPLPPPPQPPPPTNPRPSGGFIAAMVISGLFVGLFVVGSVISAVDSDKATGSGSNASPSVPVSTSTMTETAEPIVDPTESPPTADPEAPGVAATVTRVVDGDTIEVDFEGKTLDVRLIGIDTPETVDPSEPVGCYGPAASHFTTNEIEGEHVRLEFDVERLDQYERTLAYVWLGDELFNETLVARGFATVTTYPPNVKYVDRFLSAQRDARSHERGLWGAACNEPEPVSTGGGGGGGGRECDPSYPTVCIPPYPPDLDCDDVPFSFFEVKPPDPHGFDGEGDGVGCES